MEKCGRQPLSAVLITRNEARRLDECLASLAWVDEIVVVDSGSDDNTVEIARRYTDMVFQIPWRGFGPQKQAAVELASNDIILSIDADERVTTELAEEIENILKQGFFASGYLLPRRTFVGSKEIRHCGWYPDYTVRLFDRNRGRFSDDPVHERVVAEGSIGCCKAALLHYSFSGIDDMLSKMRLYTDISARHLFSKGRRCRIFDISLRPLFAFFKTFILKAGVLDGVAGLTVASLNAISVFVKYIKLRELQEADKQTNVIDIS